METIKDLIWNLIYIVSGMLEGHGDLSTYLVDYIFQKKLAEGIKDS